VVTHSRSLDAPDAVTWLKQLDGRYGAGKSEPVRTAYAYLEEHGAQLNADSGTPLIQHALGCALQLSGMNFDPETLAAALLCNLPPSELQAERLNARVGDAVSRLTQGVLSLGRMDQLLAESAADGHDQNEALRQMLLAMTDDIRVVLVKLAERVQTLRELAGLDNELRHRIATDAREYYAPLANRLGVWQFKWELEDLACRFLEPDTYKRIAKQLEERRLDREVYIEQVTQQLSSELEQAGIQEAALSGRPKHIASILAKMRKKHLSFEEVYDVRAVRVLVRDVKDCYHALGIVHSLWQPIPGQFDDYVSRPKGNGYKSLHTAVIGPENKALEVQIRTFEMHQEAELGVAAHWRYKEGGRSGQLTDKIAWLRQLVIWRQEMGDSGDTAQQFQKELFQDDVFVLTPQGKVIALPQGATPLDFAYTVHTELGHRCRGAKVDGSIVPLETALQTGQRVEILTVKQGGPSRDWLNPHLGYLKTHRAQSKVRQWFRQQDLDTHIQEGRNQLERELHRLGLANVNLDKLAGRLKLQRPEDLFADLGRGDVGSTQLERALQDEFLPPPEKPLVVAPRKSTTSPSGVLVEGEANLLTQLAGCCKPAPPDPIVGYTTLGRGVTIHRTDCPVVLTLPEERKGRLLHATWGSQAGELFPVDVELVAHDRQGLLKDITDILLQEKINVIRVNTESQEGEARMAFTVEVRDIGQLSRFLGRASHLRGVVRANRK
jgi:GTP pyrophosphokinase